MSFQVSYSFKTHKVTCPPNSSINQLIELSKAKFKISQDANVDILHKDKAIDPSLPLRFANLPNNSKLTLVVKESPSSKEVNVKLSLPSGGSHIVKIDNHKTILELLTTVEQTQKLDLLNQEALGVAHLQILNSKIEEKDFHSSKLVSIIGNAASSVVCRLSYIKEGDEEKRKLEQDRINAMQLQKQKVRNELKRREEEKKLEEQKKLRDEAASKERLEADVYPEENEIINTSSTPMDIDSHEDHSTLKSQPLNEKQTRAAPAAAAAGEVKQVETVNAVPGNSVSATSTTSSNPTGAKQTSAPQVFLPSNSTPEIYDHSEETYEMTMEQAQKYQRILSASARPQGPKQIRKIPDTYYIRIKFPDLSTLQLTFEDGPSVKFGAILKKLDEILLPQFKNQYDLKFGYPPFTNIPFSFKNNDEFLHNLTVSKNANDVFTEKTSLIWVLHTGQVNTRGPFINQETSDIIVTSNNDRPEIQLESHRGELPDDPKPRSHGDAAEGKKGVPKWLKLNK